MMQFFCCVHGTFITLCGLLSAKTLKIIVALVFANKVNDIDVSTTGIDLCYTKKGSDFITLACCTLPCQLFRLVFWIWNVFSFTIDVFF